MRKRCWKNGTCKRSGSELGLESEECRSLHDCVCVYLCFRNIWTSFKVTKKVLKSCWDSWKNRVSLVVVKPMLSMDEIQGTWIYLPAMCYMKPSQEVGRGWPSWASLILAVNPLHLFEGRCSQDLVELSWNFWIEILNQAWGVFPLKTSMSWNKNKIYRNASDPL